jgi:hypothetical protein
MTLARMTTAQDETNSGGGYATHVCRLKPGDMGSGEVEGQELYYVDSLKAPEKLLTYVNYSEKDWEFTTPTDVDGWTCNRQYYEGTLSSSTSNNNVYGSPASLKVVYWDAEWRVQEQDGSYTTTRKGVFAGDKLNVGKARDVTLTAVWGTTKYTAFVDLETSKTYLLDETSSSMTELELSPDQLLDESKDLRVVIPVLDSVSRASYTICGGGGCGAERMTEYGVPTTRYLNGGGGASGEYLNETHLLRTG